MPDSEKTKEQLLAALAAARRRIAALEARETGCGQAGESLHAQPRILELILAQPRVGYFDWMIQDGAEYVNGSFKRMLGYEDQEPDDRFVPWQNRVFPEDLPGLLDVFRKHVESRGQAPYHREVRYRRKDGSLVWVLRLGAVISWDEQGRPLRMAGLHVDITRTKRAEEALRELEERFRLASQAAGVCLWEVDWATGDVWHSADFERSFGPGPQDAENSRAWWRERMHPEDRDPVADSLEAFLAGSGERWENEFRFTNPAGLTVYVNDRAVVSRDADGKPLRMIGAMLDITGRKKNELELLRLKEAAEAASLAKSEFLAVMSHEIRTPLNGIVGALQLMDSAPLDAQQQECLQMALGSSHRLTRLLCDILDMSKIEVGKLVIQEQEFEVNGLTRSVMESFVSPAKEKGLSLEFSLDERLPHILIGDETRLRQILFNLIGNAIKFTSKGSVRIEAYPLRSENNVKFHLLFIIRDTGIGMSDELIKVVFNPFIRGEDALKRRFQGAGLGLSIVRKLVEMMRGGLAIDSAVGDGTTIYVSLPLKFSGAD